MPPSPTRRVPLEMQVSTPKKNLLSIFDEQNKLFSERIGVRHSPSHLRWVPLPRSHTHTHTHTHIKVSPQQQICVAAKMVASWNSCIMTNSLWQRVFSHGSPLLWITLPVAMSLIARFMGPTWGLSGADRTQVGPMLAPRTLLSGVTLVMQLLHCAQNMREGNLSKWWLKAQRAQQAQN